MVLGSEGRWGRRWGHPKGPLWTRGGEGRVFPGLRPRGPSVLRESKEEGLIAEDFHPQTGAVSGGLEKKDKKYIVYKKLTEDAGSVTPVLMFFPSVGVGDRSVIRLFRCLCVTLLSVLPSLGPDTVPSGPNECPCDHPSNPVTVSGRTDLNLLPPFLIYPLSPNTHRDGGETGMEG